MPTPHTVYVIAGPTAVGKTAAAIRLAQRLQVPIVSADSRQCYTELGIGVAKPSAEELQAVPHYFINSHSIHEEMNAGLYEQYALNVVTTLLQQFGSVVMVGGTGLYVKAFCDGIDAMPAIDTAIREQLLQQYQLEGLPWLQQQIQQLDPAFWAVAEQQNPQRLLRALEVVTATGQSITEFRVQQKQIRPFAIQKIGLELPRTQLYERINQRVVNMVASGLVAEAEQLYIYKHLNALQTVGYKELFDYFDGHCNLPQAIEQIQINTRHYAKRQMTWFKKDPAFVWQLPEQEIVGE